MKEIAFRTAVFVANNITSPASYIQWNPSLISNWTQTVTLESKESQVVYSVSVPYIISAVVMSLLSIVAVVPLLLGWKAVPVRSLSFNPLTVATAFDAPLMREHKDKEEVTAVKRSATFPGGTRRVIYDNNDQVGQLRMK
jgi:hypothetical protein